LFSWIYFANIEKSRTILLNNTKKKFPEKIYFRKKIYLLKQFSKLIVIILPMSALNFHAIPQAFTVEHVNAYEFVATAHLAGNMMPTHVCMLPVDKRHAVPRIFVSLEDNYEGKMVISMKIYSREQQGIQMRVNHFCENTYEKNHFEVLQLGGHCNNFWEFSGKMEGNEYSNGCLLDTKWLISVDGNPIFTIRIVDSRRGIIPADM